MISSEAIMKGSRLTMIFGCLILGCILIACALSLWFAPVVDEETINGGTEAYYKEVLVPYCLMKKKIEDLPKRYFKIEEEIK